MLCTICHPVNTSHDIRSLVELLSSAKWTILIENSLRSCQNCVSKSQHFILFSQISGNACFVFFQSSRILLIGCQDAFAIIHYPLTPILQFVEMFNCSRKIITRDQDIDFAVLLHLNVTSVLILSSKMMFLWIISNWREKHEEEDKKSNLDYFSRF